MKGYFVVLKNLRHDSKSSGSKLLKSPDRSLDFSMTKKALSRGKRGALAVGHLF